LRARINKFVFSAVLSLLFACGNDQQNELEPNWNLECLEVHSACAEDARYTSSVLAFYARLYDCSVNLGICSATKTGTISCSNDCSSAYAGYGQCLFVCEDFARVKNSQD